MKTKMFILIGLLLVFLNLFVLIASSQPIPLIPTPVEPSLIINAPLYVVLNEIFTVEVIFLEGSYGFSELYSINIQSPSGFRIIERGKFGWKSSLLGKEGYYRFIVKAPEKQTKKDRINVVMRYKAKLFKRDMIIQGNHAISAADPLRIKYRVNFDSVSPDYNGNIGLAAFVESLPTFIPLGYFVLGDKREEDTWKNTYTMDSLPLKVIETLALIFALSASETTDGKYYINPTKLLIGGGVYFYTLFNYDLPNLYKSHEARTEVAKLKRDGKIK